MQVNNAKSTDWKIEDLPQQRATILLDRTFSLEEMVRIRKGLVPERMEDKWFIYWSDSDLFFHRSWTGFCIYIAHFATEGDCWKMLQADVNRDPKQYTETFGERDAEMISYLVDVLLLHRNAIFSSDELSSARSELMNWSEIGRAMLGQHPNGDGTAQQDFPADEDKPRR